MSSSRRIAATGLGLMLALFAPDAQAHLVETGLGPVYDGIAHFALSPEAILPVLAMAGFAGLRGKDQVRSVMLVLPAAWLLAGVVGLWSGPPPISVPLWSVLLALGALLAADLRLPLGATAAVAVGLGGLLGFANGEALAQSKSGVRELLGIVSALFVFTTLVAAAVLALGGGWTRVACRVVGSWIAASGLLLLGWSLRR